MVDNKSFHDIIKSGFALDYDRREMESMVGEIQIKSRGTLHFLVYKILKVAKEEMKE